MLNLQNLYRRRNRADGGNNGTTAGVPRDNHEPPEGRRDIRRAPTAQPQEDSVLVRAIRKMKLVGLRQAFKPGTSMKECIFWVGVFLICVYFTIHLAALSVEEYAKDKTNNAIHDDVNINHAPFPGLSITATKTIKTSGIDNAIDMFFNSNYGDFALAWTKGAIKKLLFTVDHFCEMASSFASKLRFLDVSQTLNLKSTQIGELDVDLRDDPSDPVMRDKIMPYIRENMLNCTSILLACSWEGSETDCNELFTPVMTDAGMGCSFNKIPNDILRKSHGLMSLLYNRMNLSQKEKEDWTNWNMEKELTNAIHKMKSGRKFPRGQSAAGNLKGISLLLLHDPVQNFSCPSASSNGFMLTVHSPFEEPDVIKNGVGVPPGHEVFVKVRGELTVADEDIRDLPIEERNCVYENEANLTVFTRYTLANCRKECLARRIASECQCHQLFMSSGQNETICGPSQVSCVQNVSNMLDQDGYGKMCAGDLKKCLPPCSEVKYVVNSVSYLPYHNPIIFNYDRFGISPYSTTSIAHVSYESDMVTARVRKKLMIFAFLLGVVGGILGMAMELSIPSIFNIVAGMGILVSALHQVINKRFFTKPGDDISNHNASNEQGPNVGDENTGNNRDGSDDDSSSGEDDLDTGQGQNVSDEGDVHEQEAPSDLPNTSSKFIRRAVRKDVKQMKQALQVELKESNEELMRDLKKDIALVLQESRKATAELNANQRLVIDFTEAIASDLNNHKAIMENFKETIAADMKETRDLVAELAGTLQKKGLEEPRAPITSKESLERVGSSSDSLLDQVEFTDVHSMDGKRSVTPFSRFQNASNLAVLFTRSTKRTKSTHSHTYVLTPEDNRDESLEQIEPKDSLETPAHSIFPINEEVPSSTPMVDLTNDSQDDDFVETIILP